MFDHDTVVVGLPEEIGDGFLASGESFDITADDDVSYLVTCLELADRWETGHRQLLPPGFDSIPTGPYLAATLSGIDRSRLNGFDLVRLLEAEARLESSYAAGKLATVSEIVFCPPGGADSPVERSVDEVEYAEAEVAAALTLTRKSANALTERALWFGNAGRRVRDAMTAGTVSAAKAQVFHRALWHLDSDTVGSVLDETLDEASELTTGQLAYRISRQVMTADPDGAKSSMAEGLKDRKVVSYANPDFTGCLHICSAHPFEVAAAQRYVDRVAKKLKTDSEERSLDELRNDVATALLQGINPLDKDQDTSTTGGGVHLTVPLVTLADLADYPGDLAGYAPVVADVVRQIGLHQVDGHWTWTVTHHDQVIATGTTRYRPTESQRRQARAEYPACVAPGCRMPAINCDLDHRQPYSHGGHTHNHNLAPLCRYHHMMRHHTPWEYIRQPNGDHQWTSPLSHTYTRRRGPPDAA